VLVEWLHAGRPGTIRRAEAVEADLAVVEAAQVDGLDGLLTRLARGSREDVFATLAELFVAAWYLRSDAQVLAVHADQGAGDVVISVGEDTAYVEVRELSAPAEHYLWGERWNELGERLKELALPFRLDVHGVTDLRYEVLPGGSFPEPVRIAAPDMADIEWFVKQVVSASQQPRPWTLAAGFSKKYPDLCIEGSDRVAGVSLSFNSSGWAHPPGRLVDRILKKDPPARRGRHVLMVEMSRFPGETLLEEGSLEQVRKLIAVKVKSWDAIVAFTRQWVQPEVADVYVLHERNDTARFLPALPIQVD
jgi:hypothetical protein